MKIAKIAIFFTGMFGLALGGLMSISSLRSQQQEAQIRIYDNLKSEAQILVDQFYSAIEATKNLSQNNVNLSSLPYVTHVGILKLNQLAPGEFESLATREQMQLGVGKDGKPTDSLPDLALEDRVFKALQHQFSYGDLQITKFTIGTFEPNELSSREGIFVATPVYKVTNNVVDPTIIDKLNITLLDPVKIMASFSKGGRDGRNAFLIDKTGRVLAHTSSSYVGSELKKFESLKEPIESLFLGAQTGISTHYASVEGRSQLVSFVRAGVYPFAIAAEQAAPPAVLSKAWWSDQAASGAARQNLGILLIITAVGLGVFAGASVLISRNLPSAELHAARERRQQNAPSVNATSEEIATNDVNSGLVAPGFRRWTTELRKKQIELQTSAETKPQTSQTSQTQTAISIPPDFTPPASIAKAAQSAAESFVETRAQLQATNENRQEQAKRILVAKDYEKEFVERIRTNYTLETIEREMANVASELTESPVLYFRYHRQTQNLNLASVAGQVQIPNYALMQAYIRKDIEQQVERLASEGRIASISNYGPVSKLMISNLNTAHFEAWVVTSDPEISGNARMVGVLVILQAGFRSAQTRPVLANILKEGGNYLHAQTSKLRPRRYDDPATQKNAAIGLPTNLNG